MALELLYEGLLAVEQLAVASMLTVANRTILCQAKAQNRDVVILSEALGSVSDGICRFPAD